MKQEKCVELIGMIKKSSVECVEAFYNENRSAFSTVLNDDGYFALHFAVLEGRLDLVKLILKQRPYVMDWKNYHEETPLLLAASLGHANIVEYLMQQGADCTVSSKDRESFTKERRTVIGWAKKSNHQHCINIIHEVQYQQLMQAMRTFVDGAAPSLAMVSLVTRIVKTVNQQAIEFLIDETNYLRTLPIKKRLDLLKVAHEVLDCETLKKFLEPRHQWPASVNASGYSLLEWTVKKGLNKFLTVFSEIGLNYLPLIEEPGIDPMLHNLLDLAKRHGQFTTLNLLIIHSFHAYQRQKAGPSSSSESIDWALQTRLSNYICNGQQFMELASMEKSLIPWLIQIENYHQLLINDNAIQFQDGKYTVYLPSNRRRPLSMHCEFEPALQSMSIFKPSDLRGVGGFAYVRRFLNEQNQVKAVKSFFQTTKYELENEQSLLQRAYPEYSFFGFINRSQTKARLVMPFFQGQTLDRAFQSIVCERSFVELIYQVVQSIYRVHKEEIIHGDITSRNFIVNKENGQWMVRLIDLGLASHRYGCSIEGFSLKDKKIDYPPELFGDDIKIVPHPSQDIYMLGFLLKTNIEKSKIGSKITESYPFIWDFINKALSIDPKQRPKLGAFCKELATAIEVPQIPPEAGTSMSC